MSVRTVHLTNAWHPASGGIRTFYEALLQRAAADRRNIAVIVPGERTTVSQVGPTARLYTIEAPRSPLFDRRYRVLLPHRYLRVSRSVLWRILAREQPDVVEISDKYCLCHLAGLIKGRARGGIRPTLVALSQERLDDNIRAWVSDTTWAQRCARQYLRWVYLTQFDAHIANSEYTAQELRDIVARSRPRQTRIHRLGGRVHVVPLGVDATGFGPGRRSHDVRLALLRRAGGSENTSLIVYAGRLSPEKYVQWLPEIVSRLRAVGLDVALAVAGDGPARGHVEAGLLRAAGGRAVFLGHLHSRDELATLLASADLFLHPNPREPFGIGPLEAMASGTPVVAPRAGGVLSYADEATAWLGEPSVDGLAHAVSHCLADPVAARARATAGRFRAASLDWPRVARRFLDLYEWLHTERLAAEAPPASGPRVPSPVAAVSVHRLAAGTGPGYQ